MPFSTHHVHILLLRNGRRWHLTFSSEFTVAQSCYKGPTGCLCILMQAQSQVPQTLSACNKVHECTPLLALMQQIHFGKYLFHTRFAFSEASRSGHYLEKQCTHSLIFLLPSPQHGQHQHILVLQMVDEAVPACQAEVLLSIPLPEMIKYTNSNPAFVNHSYQYQEKWGQKQFLSSYAFSNRQRHMKYLLGMTFTSQSQV